MSRQKKKNHYLNLSTIFELGPTQNPGPNSYSLSEDSSVAVVVVVVFGDWMDLLSLSACPSEESSSEVFRFLIDFGLGLLFFVFFCFGVCLVMAFLGFLMAVSSCSSEVPLKK